MTRLNWYWMLNYYWPWCQPLMGLVYTPLWYDSATLPSTNSRKCCYPINWLSGPTVLLMLFSSKQTTICGSVHLSNAGFRLRSGFRPSILSKHPKYFSSRHPNSFILAEKHATAAVNNCNHHWCRCYWNNNLKYNWNSSSWCFTGEGLTNRTSVCWLIKVLPPWRH